MKKIILYLFIPLVLFGSSLELEKKIYATILRGIFPHKNVKVWSDDSQKQKLLSTISFVKIVNDKTKADFILLYHDQNLSSLKGVVFAGKYTILKQYKDSVIGGFYWQKGRPNIIFLKNNLQKHHIVLPPDMQQYIESEL